MSLILSAITIWSGMLSLPAPITVTRPIMDFRQWRA
jgi:hypothetical protein